VAAVRVGWAWVFSVDGRVRIYVAKGKGEIQGPFASLRMTASNVRMEADGGVGIRRRVG
jgi:hypothetical protein